MRRRMAGSWVIIALVLPLLFCGALPALGGTETTPKAAYEKLEQRFASLRADKEKLKTDAFVAELDRLEADVRGFADGKDLDPDSKAKSLELLSRLCEYSGKVPESEQAYASYLKALTEWQGEDVAARVARREDIGFCPAGFRSLVLGE